jgi:2-amino-4-hydroxy-6-hydroxymethyldihydropteridine diphosphokinase
MTRGYISIGSNIDKERHIPSAIRALQERFGTLTLSGIYETEAVGFIGASFYNLVAGFDSELDVKEIGKILRQIETDHGRNREAKKFTSRTLDLDLILYGDLVISDGRLQIPRNEIFRYAFVLEPLAEIAPDLQHPVTHESYAGLWAKFDKTHLHRRRFEPGDLNGVQRES